MLHEEAFDVLGLGAGATETEIKQAYRDLVKVWHPDRFGSDPLLRQKAEDKLRQINIAHELLQSPPKEDYSYTPRETQRRYAETSTVLRKKKARWSTAMTIWTGGGLGIAIAIAVAILANALSARRTEAPVIREVQTPKSTDVEGHVESVLRNELKVPKDASHSQQAASAQFRVRPLSGAETARLESACPVEKKTQDPTGYQDCVRAQLGASAPDLSALSADDRAGIESACRKTKIQEGSAAYNRCLTRMVRSLDESTHRRAVE